MKIDAIEFTMLHGLADEMDAVLQYAARSETCVSGDQTDLHMAILMMHDDFPEWLQQRIAVLDDASAVRHEGRPQS